MIRAGKRVTPHVTHLQEVRSGEIWLSTSGQGLFRLDSLLNRAVSVDGLFQQINCTYQSKFCIDSRSEIWIGTEGNGLARYIPKSKQLQFFKYPAFGDNNVTSIIEDHLGNIFVGTQNKEYHDMIMKRERWYLFLIVDMMGSYLYIAWL